MKIIKIHERIGQMKRKRDKRLELLASIGVEVSDRLYFDLHFYTRFLSLSLLGNITENCTRHLWNYYPFNPRRFVLSGILFTFLCNCTVMVDVNFLMENVLIEKKCNNF